MRSISGKVTCNEAQEIPAGAVAEILVNDNSIKGRPSKTLGKVVINDPKAFPIEFTIEYDEAPVLKIIRGIYSIQVNINLGDRLIFCTDTQFGIVNRETETIKDHLDVFVVKVVSFDDDAN